MKPSRFSRSLKKPTPARCPFCTSTTTRLVAGGGLSFVWCHNCKAQGPRFDASAGGQVQSIQFWNRAPREK